MQDFTYTDAETNTIIVVCVCVKDICEADYQFKDAMGDWPWKFKNVQVTKEASSLQVLDSSKWYIPE